MYILSVRLRKEGSKVYDSKEYWYLSEVPVDIGGKVIVNTSDSLEIAEVNSLFFVDDLNISGYIDLSKYDHIVQVVDFSAYDKYKNTELLTLIKSKLDKRINELKENYNYEKFAKEDELVAELLHEYKRLTEKRA